MGVTRKVARDLASRLLLFDFKVELMNLSADGYGYRKHGAVNFLGPVDDNLPDVFIVVLF